MRYVVAQSHGFEGTFNDWLLQNAHDPTLSQLPKGSWKPRAVPASVSDVITPHWKGGTPVELAQAPPRLTDGPDMVPVPEVQNWERPQRREEEWAIDAALPSIQFVNPHMRLLGGDSSDAVAAPELLLAALEAMHVDNARIEIETGWEVRPAGVGGLDAH